jgi:hypothetical protein
MKGRKNQEKRLRQRTAKESTEVRKLRLHSLSLIWYSERRKGSRPKRLKRDQLNYHK